MQAALYSAIQWVKDRNWPYIWASTLDRLERTSKMFLPDAIPSSEQEERKCLFYLTYFLPLTPPILEGPRQKSLCYKKNFRARPSEKTGAVLHVKSILEQRCKRHISLVERYRLYVRCGPNDFAADLLQLKLRKKIDHELAELRKACDIAHLRYSGIPEDLTEADDSLLPPSLKREFEEALHQDFRTAPVEPNSVRIA